MTEKILHTKKNGMAAMLINLLALVLAIVGLVFGIITTEADPSSVPGIILCVAGAIVLVLGWIPLCGLKVLKPQEALVREELNRTMESLLSMLNDRQQRILRLRFGMEDGKPHSLEEIGHILGISKERVRQVEKQAMDKLKKLGADMGLEDFLE